MSARDDYPYWPAPDDRRFSAEGAWHWSASMDEIDRLRADLTVANLRGDAWRAEFNGDTDTISELRRQLAALNVETFHAIRLADGGLIYGDYSWMAADGPDDWTVAEESDHDDPTDYEIVVMHVEVVNRRTFGTPPGDDDDDDCSPRGMPRPVL